MQLRYVLFLKVKTVVSKSRLRQGPGSSLNSPMVISEFLAPIFKLLSLLSLLQRKAQD